MPRHDFISDDLVNMRERLRRNYESFHAQQRENAGLQPLEPPEKKSPETEVPLVEMPGKRPGTPVLPSLTTAFDDTPFAAERRALEGKMLRDLACSEEKQRACQAACEAAEKFHGAVENALAALHALDEAGGMTPAEKKQNFYAVSGDYFRALGIFEAMENRGANLSAAVLQRKAETKGFGARLGEELPLVLAILLSGALIAGVIALIFG